MIKFKVQFLDENGDWQDARTAFTLEEAERKEAEVKETGVKTRIIEVKDGQNDS